MRERDMGTLACSLSYGDNSLLNVVNGMDGLVRSLLTGTAEDEPFLYESKSCRSMAH
jgi:hypothetical protein